MRVLSFLPRYDLKKRVERALSSAQFVIETAASAKECSYSTQRTHYDGVLVDADSLDFRDALGLVKHLRRENSDASLFVFARYPDLEQRLALFEAGVDDYVMILEHVWNSSFEGLTNVVDVYISSLRSKVDRDFPQKLIQTKRGIGYTLTHMTARG